MAGETSNQGSLTKIPLFIPSYPTTNMADARDLSNPREPEAKRVEYEDHFSETAPAKLKTPASCVADFCLIPIGTPTASVSNQIADVQRLMQTCGLSYSMHSAGTTVGS